MVIDRGTLYVIVFPLMTITPFIIISVYLYAILGELTPVLVLWGLTLITLGLIVLFIVPLYVEIRNDAIYVRYVVRKAYICSIKDILQAEVIDIDPKVLINQFQCCGNRGFFGFAGCCKGLKDLDDVCIYTRRSGNLVVLHLKTEYISWIRVRKVIVMPKDLEQFISELKSRGIMVIDRRVIS